MMKKKLSTRQVNTEKDARAFFDASAGEYREAHGNADQLLQYRLKLIDRHLDLNVNHSLLDVGCGNGIHIFPLLHKIKSAIGADFSPKMIEIATAQAEAIGVSDKTNFIVANAADMPRIDSAQFDLSMCIGALEHMIEKQQVLHEIFRLLKPGGKFFLLTPNADYLWYKRIAPFFNIDTTHLSSDRFLTKMQLTEMAKQAGFENINIGNWTFIPKGDIPACFHFGLELLEELGKMFRINAFRGGLLMTAERSRNTVL